MLEFGVAEVEGEGGGGGFAGFDGAGEEVGGEDFHFGGRWGLRAEGGGEECNGEGFSELGLGGRAV